MHDGQIQTSLKNLNDWYLKQCEIKDKWRITTNKKTKQKCHVCQKNPDARYFMERSHSNQLEISTQILKYFEKLREKHWNNWTKEQINLTLFV